ncbi:nicastrin [Nymphaea colorata]|nr:nicastrin [Nymphaea colorata]
MALKLHYHRLLSLVLLILLLFSVHRSSAGVEESFLESVPDLQNKMYMVVDGYPCVRLLNISGEIGCANPGRVKVVAPIVRFTNDMFKLVSPSAVLVPPDKMEDFFNKLHSDKESARKIAGVLIKSNIGYSNEIFGFSPVGKFPQAEFAPYRNTKYNWNPAGSGVMWNRYDFPVFLLSQNSTLKLEEIVESAEVHNDKFHVDVAEFDVVMQTTKVGNHNSETCLKDQSCLPLGGYSVWSSLPPINVSSQMEKPIILAMASQDSASFFRDRTFGADSHLSGMIALLAAIDALSHVDNVNEFGKQLVFIFFTGEAWGYLGSRRFLHELDLGSESVVGLKSSLIEKVLDVGSVGKGFSEGKATFFSHVEEESSGSKEILSALEKAAASLKPDEIVIQNASSSNPGIPPSSLMPFFRKNPSTAGVVLEEFDSVFSNKFYYSHPDDSSNINTTSIVSAAAVVARALYILASSGSGFSSSILSSININASLVEELVACLLTCEPGFSCKLARNFIISNGACPNHYVGVMLGSPVAVPSLENVGDTSRFIWNFLAERNSIRKASSNSSCSQGCTSPTEVCVGAETGKGVCVISTTRYVPAYSTRLKFENGWRLVATNAEDPLGEVDPVWTESFWNSIGLRAYKVQSQTYDQLILWVGIALTISSYVAILAAKAALRKSLKRD